MGKRKSKTIGKNGWLAIGAAGLVLGAMSIDPEANAAVGEKKPPSATTVPSKRSSELSEFARQCLPIGKALKKQGWQDVATGVTIAAAESGCRDINNAGTNKDGSIDYCPMQINNIHKKDVSTLDKCAKAAVEIRKMQGLTAWSTVNNGRTKQARFVQVGHEVAEELS